MNPQRLKMSVSAMRAYLKEHHSKYKNCKDFLRRDPEGKYLYSQVRRKILKKEDFYQYWPKVKPYTIKQCVEAAAKCKNRFEMKTRFAGQYDRVVKKAWLKHINKVLPQSKRYKGYNKKECREIAKKCKNKYDMQQRFRGYYSKARDMGWVDSFFKVNYQRIGYTFNQCKAKAKGFKTKKRFQEAHISHYNRARAKGWLKDICSHMVDGTQLRSISFKECQSKAKKCKSRVIFGEKFPSHYNRARKQKWLEEICAHMVFLQRTSEKESEKKLIKLLNKKVEIIHYQKLFKDFKSRPDFIIKFKNRIWIIELKDDRSDWSPRLLRTQKEKYDELGNRKFKTFEETLIVSPKGKYGLSFNQLVELFS